MGHNLACGIDIAVICAHLILEFCLAHETY